MAYYYLISQLPNISSQESKSALPLNTFSFKELACRFISEQEKQIVNSLSLVPSKELESTGSVFLDTWYEKERNLRFALAQIRAQKMKKDSIPLPAGITADIISAARTGNVVVAQDHNVYGGLGSIVGTAIAEEGLSTKFKICGINDEFVAMAHAKYLYHHFGIDGEGLKNSMLEMLDK